MGNGARRESRQGVMAELLTYILNHPGCGVHNISVNTSIPKTEVSRYLRGEKYEFRPLSFMLEMRETNRIYYNHLLHDAVFCKRDDVDGFLINTSKREMFERFCLKYGFYLSTNSEGLAFVMDYESYSGVGPEERSKVLRYLEMDNMNTKNLNERP
jgi:hypothetical protein